MCAFPTEFVSVAAPERAHTPQRKSTKVRPKRTCRCGADITLAHGSAKACYPCTQENERRIKRLSNLKKNGISAKSIVAYMEAYTPKALAKIKADILRIRQNSLDTGAF